MLMGLPIALFCLGLVKYSYANSSSPPWVMSSVGELTGYYKTSLGGKMYQAYEGIPYALPPVGKLRFKPPRRYKWKGELLATQLSSPCIQYTYPYDNTVKVEGEEDCLYLNIYVSEDGKEYYNRKPVLFWIHGGFFQRGSGMTMNEKYFMDYDMILVTFNYRLGPMGFLSFENDFIAGNMGLKDQNMALRWISDNIEWFGGDPKRIILAGVDAGGASVHYHYLSEMSAGLFQGGISIGGTAFDCWAHTENALEKAEKLIDLLECTNAADTVQCLKRRPARAIVRAVGEYIPFQYNPFLVPFGPVIEPFAFGPFIYRKPIDIVNINKVQKIPWIVGVVDEEGIYPATRFVNSDKYLKHLNNRWNKVAPLFLDFNNTIPKQKHVRTARLIKEHYFGINPIDKQHVKTLIKMVIDRFFMVNSEKAARLQANKAPVWYFYYTYKGAQRLMSKTYSSVNEDVGVCHGDEDLPWMCATKEEDYNMQRYLLDLYLSFSKNEFPSIADVDWPKLDPSMKELHYLHINGPTEIYMNSSDNFGEKEFWNSIDFNENKKE